MKEITLQTVEFLEGGFYFYGDYTVIVSQRLGNRYNVVIQRGDEVSTCCGLSCEQIKQVIGCIGGGFVEPVWTPQTRNDGIIRHEKFDKILKLVEKNVPVYLYGPAGSGKNEICKQIAKELNLEFYFSNCITQEHKLTGYGDAVGKLVQTPFYKAWTNGGLFFLDEFDGSIPETALVLNAALANGYFDFPVIGNVDAHPDFRIIAAGNTLGRGADKDGLHDSRFVLDAATLDRFWVEEIKYDTRVEDSISCGDGEITEFIRDLRNASERIQYPMVLGYRAISRLAKMSSVFTSKDCLNGAVLKGTSVDEMQMLYQNIEHKRNRFAKALKELAFTA